MRVEKSAATPAAAKAAGAACSVVTTAAPAGWATRALWRSAPGASTCSVTRERVYSISREDIRARHANRATFGFGPLGELGTGYPDHQTAPYAFRHRRDPVDHERREGDDP